MTKTTEAQKQATRRWRANNPEKYKENNRKYYLEHPEKYVEYSRRWRKKNPEQSRAYHLEWKRKTKEEVLTYYGEGKCACIRCGFSDVRALSIDHIQGGGKKHIVSLNWRSLYPYLKGQHFPSGYQTLCMNCQFIKRSEEKEYS